MFKAVNSNKMLANFLKQAFDPIGNAEDFLRNH